MYAPFNSFQCSSASRKFLNRDFLPVYAFAKRGFSALQRAENSSTTRTRLTRRSPYVSVLFSEPKIPQQAQRLPTRSSTPVSVLFSEPKIPQPCSSIWRASTALVSVLFSEPKIPQDAREVEMPRNFFVSVLFSEPKIPQGDEGAERRAEVSFQCSSASRKFLNPTARRTDSAGARFSALQRAENSSTYCTQLSRTIWRVSVLFSEPKIPQPATSSRSRAAISGFSALQRAENSSTWRGCSLRRRW